MDFYGIFHNAHSPSILQKKKSNQRAAVKIDFGCSTDNNINIVCSLLLSKR